MSEPVRLDVYREQPAVVLLLEREHAAVCGWCRWSNHAFIQEKVCYSPRNNPTRSIHKHCTDFVAECESYTPSLWTRLLQWLGTRPFVERSPKRSRT